MEKRISCRAIIFKDNSLVTMHRIKESNEYYVYPGGGLDEGETLEECVIREVDEEFGISIKVLRKVYEYSNDNSIQHYYLCEWIDGELGTGSGPEILNPHKGQYTPMLLEINKMEDVIFQPLSVTKQFLDDINKYGRALDNKVKIINE